MILVSACLAGIKCKYNGGDNTNEEILKLIKEKKAVLACPEQLGGLSTPRIPAEIVGGTGEDVLDGKAKVINQAGEDVTEAFLKGAKETLKMVQMMNIKKVILKAKSPSCGKENIYDGTFTGTLRSGMGVTTALLQRNGIIVYTENDKMEEGFYEGADSNH